MAYKVRASLPLHATEYNKTEPTKDEKKVSWGTETKKDSKGNTLGFVRKSGEATGSWVIVKKAATEKAAPKKTIKYKKGGIIVGDSLVPKGKGKEYALTKGWKIR